MAAVCALPSCGKDLRFVNPTFRANDKVYCSREHCQEGAVAVKPTTKSKSKKESETPNDEEPVVPHEPADDFGGAGVIRHFCDRNGCKKPITLGWKGRNGEYCSNECLKLAEKDKKNMTTEETNDSPISAGTATKKAAKKNSSQKAAKKVAAKKAAAKKGSKKTGDGGGPGTRRSQRVITVVNVNKVPEAKGLMAEAFKLALKSKTEGDLLEKLRDKTSSPYNTRLKAIAALVEAGAIKVTDAAA